MKHAFLRILALAAALMMLLTSALAYEKLQSGDKNSDVLRMQQALNRLGYSLKEDGSFGSGTLDAVKDFQKKYGLEVDGVAGNKTLTLLYQIAGEAKSAPSPTPTKTPAAGAYATLRKNDSGNAVLAMQQALQKLGYFLTADGKYGDGTVSAVKSFQAAHGLKNDGIAGSQTLTLLYQLAAQAQVSPTPSPTPSKAPAPVTYATLRKGSSGQAVLAMQQALQKLGYFLTADGKYGDGTVSAVKSFQAAHGLKNDGIAGSQTLTLLYQLAAQAQAAPTPSPTPSKAPAPVTYATLRKGSSGQAVLAMQQALQKLGYSLAADGKYGSGTMNAVKSFQAANGLKNDGIAGSQTLTLLYQLASAQTTSTPSSAPVTPPAGAITATVETGSGTLNLRAEPKSGADILGTIPNHTALSVTSRGTTWCGVIYGGRAGYVMTSFLRFAADATPTAVPTASPAPIVPTGTQTAIVTTTGGTLNFRASDSKSAKVIGQIPNAALLTVTSRGSEWCAVNYNGTNGYVMTSFLSFLTPGDSTPTDPPKPVEPQNDAVYTRTLKNGMTGEDVTWVQTRLQALGYTVTVNGVYDSATAAAVKSFQTHNCLSADGIAGSQTFTMLQSDSARKATDSIPSYTTLRVDDTGSNVTSMQNALKNLGYSVTVNGKYDEATHNAVVAFQQRNGLVISGIADGITLSMLYAGGKPFSTPVSSVDLSQHRMSAPSASAMKLLKWYDEVKPSIKTGQTALIYDPATGLCWRIKFYSLGHHADSEPLTWTDTQVMNASFGKTSWTVHPVYVQLPSGQWTMATMHNRPHLYGSIADNGFGGHLCIHFLRDVSECIRVGDDDYGVQNQRTLRSAWKALTGETIPEN